MEKINEILRNIESRVSSDPKSIEGLFSILEEEIAKSDIKEMQYQADYLKGLSLLVSNNPDQALLYLLKVLNSKYRVNPKILAKTHINLANAYRKLGELEQAYHHYKEGISRIDDNNLYVAYSNIAALLYELKLYDQALKYYEIFFRMRKEKDSAHRMAKINLAYVQSKLGNTNKAIRIIKQNIKETNKRGENNAYVMSNICLSEIYIELKDYQSAIFQLNAAQKHKAKCTVNFDDVLNLHLGRAYLGKEESTKSEECLTLAYNIFSQKNHLRKKLETLYVLKELFAKNRNFKEELRIANQIILEQKGKNDNILQRQQKKIAQSIVFSSNSDFTEVRDLRNLLEIKENHIDRLLLEAKVLRYQINPHFLFNILNNIGGLIKEENSKLALRFINSFSLFVRKVFDVSHSNLIQLNEELKITRSYIELQQLRYTNILYSISIEKQLASEKIYVPSLLIQPFVENAIKHGISYLGAEKRGVLRIKISKTKKGTIAISILNNGVNAKLDLGKINNNTPSGLSISKLRINNFNRDLAYKESIQAEVKQGKIRGIYNTLFSFELILKKEEVE